MPQSVRRLFARQSPGDGGGFVQTSALREDASMAKGQKRGNREIKKPKQDKPKPVVAASPFSSKGATLVGKAAGKK